MRAPRTTWLPLLLVALVYLALAWPGAADRGVIAEEVTPYLPRHPIVLTSTPNGTTPLPPHADADLHAPPITGWVRTPQWPNLAYQADDRTWPVLIRGYQSALGTYIGLALERPLGGGIAGIRRSSVLLGLILVLLVAAIARRLGLTAWTVALLCALSPGLFFFSRTGYAFELLSRVAMLLTLLIVAERRALTTARALLLAATISLAVVSRATILATLLPALAVLLIHPIRRPTRPHLALLTCGLVLPIILLLAISHLLGMAAGTDPTAKLALDPLAARTLLASDTLLAQLAWVTDPRTILGPLLASTPLAPQPWLALPALIVFLLAGVRWWHGRAGDAECMFLAAALGNALFGAWLYGDPHQFQLGMALEPLFALCLVSQLAALPPLPRHTLLTVVLTLRAHQLVDLLRAEHHTANPMLSGAAQRALVAALDPHARTITTAYNHVGMIETWSKGQFTEPPIHAWRALRADDMKNFTRTWTEILTTHDPHHIVLSTGTNLFEGPYTDLPAIRTALDEALATTRRKISARHTFPCESGTPCLELLDLE